MPEGNCGIVEGGGTVAIRTVVDERLEPAGHLQKK